MMQRIKKINAMSLGYNLALVYLAFGILFSIFLLLLRNSVLIDSVSPGVLNLTSSQIFLFYPLGYAIGGFFMGLIIGIIYNYVVRFTGGILIEFGEAGKIDSRSYESREHKYPKEHRHHNSKSMDHSH